MCANQTNPKPDEPVVLGGLPDGFLDDLPLEDREAISAKIAKLVRLNEYDEVWPSRARIPRLGGDLHVL